MSGRNAKRLRRYLARVPSMHRDVARRAAIRIYRDCQGHQERRDFWAELDQMSRAVTFA